MGDLAMDRSQVQVHPNLFTLRRRSAEEARVVQRNVAGDPPPITVSSLGRQRVRPGSVILLYAFLL